MSDLLLDVNDGTQMRAFTARPESATVGDAPGIIVFQEAFGVNAHIRDVTARFAGEGYVAIAPEMFHRTADPGFEADYHDFDSVRPHVQALTPDGIIADARAAYDWLGRDGAVDPNRIAAIGYCMGGRCAFFANATLPLAAAVSYYGGGNPVDRARELQSPHLFFWGGRDTHIPAPQRQALVDALIAAKRSYINVEMGDAGHGFFCDRREAYEADSAAASWALTIEFLRRKLA